MPFKLVESEEADMTHAFNTFADALQHEVYFSHAFPGLKTTIGRNSGIQRLLEERKDPRATFLKAVDTSTGEIAGHAVWLAFRDDNPPDKVFEEVKGDFWDSHTIEEREKANFAFRELMKYRKNLLRQVNGNLIVLDILAVAEKYQRQGVGRMLVRWGTELADRLGFTACVEGSEAALRLYESEGFRGSHVTVPWPKKWDRMDDVAFYWMTRTASADAQS